MLYNPGDRVIVRDDLVLDTKYFMEDQITHDSFVNGMDSFCGEVVTIEGITQEGKYTIKEWGYNWVDEMFQGLEISENPNIQIENLNSILDSLL